MNKKDYHAANWVWLDGGRFSWIEPQRLTEEEDWGLRDQNQIDNIVFMLM